MTVNRLKHAASNAELSRFSMGFMRSLEWGHNAQSMLAFTEKLIELGITSMDHADIYGKGRCETLFGEALALKPQLRYHIEIISKCGIVLNNENEPVKHYRVDSDYIIRSTEQTLKRLNTEYLDVLLIHRPSPLMNADEIASAFEKLKDSGKVRHFGVSNFNASAFSLLQSRVNSPLICNQIEISPLATQHIDNHDLDYLQEQKSIVMAWSCLGGGQLFNGTSEKSQRIRKALQIVAHELDCPNIDTIIYAWLLRLPIMVLPVLGSGKIERIQSAIASEKINLSEQQWFRIWESIHGERTA